MFPKGFKIISRIVSGTLQDCFKEVSRVFKVFQQVRFKDISTKLKGCFRELSGVFEGSFGVIQGFLKTFEEYFLDVSRMFLRCFKSVSRII